MVLKMLNLLQNKSQRDSLGNIVGGSFQNQNYDSSNSGENTTYALSSMEPTTATQAAETSEIVPTSAPTRKIKKRVKPPSNIDNKNYQSSRKGY